MGTLVLPKGSLKFCAKSRKCRFGVSCSLASAHLHRPLLVSWGKLVITPDRVLGQRVPPAVWGSLVFTLASANPAPPRWKGVRRRQEQTSSTRKLLSGIETSGSLGRPRVPASAWPHLQPHLYVSVCAIKLQVSCNQRMDLITFLCPPMCVCWSCSKSIISVIP